MRQGEMEMQGGAARRGEGRQGAVVQEGVARRSEGVERGSEARRRLGAVLGLFWACLGVIWVLNGVIMERWPPTMIFL